MRSALANPKIAILCFLLLTGSIAFLVEKDQPRSWLVFTPDNVTIGCLPADSSIRIHFITKWHSLFRLSQTRKSIGSPCGLLSFSQRRITGFPLIRHEYHRRLRFCLFSGSSASPLKTTWIFKLGYSPFGYSLISIFGCLSITKFIGSSLSLTISSYSSGLIRLDAGRRCALSQRLYTLPLPATHTLVESDWENNRWCQSITATQATSCRTNSMDVRAKQLSS